jgi:hypothetical protein
MPVREAQPARLGSLTEQRLGDRQADRFGVAEQGRSAMQRRPPLSSSIFT